MAVLSANAICKNPESVITYFEEIVTTNGKFQWFNEEIFRNMEALLTTIPTDGFQTSQLQEVIGTAMKIHDALTRGDITNATLWTKALASQCPNSKKTQFETNTFTH